MPSSATITAFYSFTANTKARASYVNTNFSNYRGHIVPIDPNTATASNDTYNLGSAEYKWKTGYFREFDANTSTAQYDFKINGATMGMCNSNGLKSATKQLFITSAFSMPIQTTTGFATLATLSVTSYNSPLVFGIVCKGNTFSSDSLNITSVGTTGSYLAEISFYLYRNDNTGLTTTGLVAQKTIDIYLDGSGVSQEYPLGSWIRFIDTTVTSGGQTYYLKSSYNTGKVSAISVNSNTFLYAHEF